MLAEQKKNQSSFYKYIQLTLLIIFWSTYIMSSIIIADRENR